MQSIYNKISSVTHLMTSALGAVVQDEEIEPPVASVIAKIKDESQLEIERSNSFLRVDRNLYLSMLNAEQTSVLALHELNRNFLIVPINLECSTGLHQTADIIERGHVSLAEIYNFDCKMQAIVRQNPNTKLVVCTGLVPAMRTRTVLLLGCHLILSRKVSLSRAFNAFSPLHSLPDYPIFEAPSMDPNEDTCAVWAGELTAASCWGALFTAVSCRWLDLEPTLTEDWGELCIAEYLHYIEYVPSICLRNNKR